ncbi:MAG: flagellar filament outer layer protein FlaA [Treponema sp.]|jgi:hypothetical protein|nr:flagellar filament outer layer protein FlaA [Treponema sp.]
MKRVLLFVLVFFCAFSLFAQVEMGQPDPAEIGDAALANASQSLKEVSVDKFEMDGYWSSHISPDDGYSTSRLFDSAGPAAKEPLEDEAQFNITERYVLGSRIDFIHRGHTEVFFRPQRPIPIEGITKTVSLWVAGRNFNHELYLLVRDYFGREFELFVGQLNFPGWKKLTVAIPPQPEDGRNGIVQRDYHYFNRMGIMITGLAIKVDPSEAYGSYYVYFDDMRAWTDVFTENNRDEDDMADSW